MICMGINMKTTVERVKELTYIPEYTLKVNQEPPDHLMPNAVYTDDDF